MTCVFGHAHLRACTYVASYVHAYLSVSLLLRLIVYRMWPLAVVALDYACGDYATIRDDTLLKASVSGCANPFPVAPGHKPMEL